MIKYILFDLDGTLTDSAPGICNSVAYSLKKYGIEEDPEKLRKFVGPPLLDSYQKYYGWNLEESRQGVVWYREYYTEKGIFENEVYNGIPELLKALKNNGKQILLATSKPEKFARQILAHFHLMQYFDCVGGAAMDESRTDKADVIAYVLEKAGVTEKEEIVMVGDREHDVIGAKKNGLRSIGVLYGYGSREELETAGADKIAVTVGTNRNEKDSLWNLLLEE